MLRIAVCIGEFMLDLEFECQVFCPKILSVVLIWQKLLNENAVL